MKSRGPYRRHSTPFKLQLCHDIRNGVIGRRDAQRTNGVSANLIQLWLTQFDRGELNDEEAEASESNLAGVNVRTTDSSHDSPIYPNLYRNVIWRGPIWSGWPTSGTSALTSTSVTRLSFSTPAAGKLLAMALQNALIRRWHWQHCIQRPRTENLLPAAFIIRTVGANTRAIPIDGRSMPLVYKVP